MGTGLAIVFAVKGYKFVAVISEGNSVERRRMKYALSADVVLVPEAPDGKLDLYPERTLTLWKSRPRNWPLN